MSKADERKVKLASRWMMMSGRKEEEIGEEEIGEEEMGEEEIRKDEARLDEEKTRMICRIVRKNEIVAK